MRTVCKFLAFCLLLAAGTGCDSNVPEPDGDSVFTEQLRQVTNEVPSFAGIDFEGDAKVDQLVVYLFESGQREAAKETLQNTFGGQAASIELRIRDTQGGASVELADEAASVVNAEGVVGVSHGENDYLFVGVTEAKAVERAKEKLRKIGISPDKVILRAVSVPVMY